MPQAPLPPRPFPTRQATLLITAGVCLYLVLGGLLLAANRNARRFHDQIFQAHTAVDTLRLSVEKMHALALLAASTGEQEFAARYDEAETLVRQQMNALDRQDAQVELGVAPRTLRQNADAVIAFERQALALAARYDQSAAWAILRSLRYEDTLGTFSRCLDACVAAIDQHAAEALAGQNRHTRAALWCLAFFTPLFAVAGGLFVRRARRDAVATIAAQNALAASEHRFRDTFELAGVGIAHVGLDSRFLLVNDHFAAITGYSPEELTATGFAGITHPDDLRADLSLLARLTAGDIPGYSMEKRYLRKDGSTAWVVLTVSLVRDQTGQPAHCISIIKDISARKAAEAAARENACTIAALLDATTDRVILADSDGRVLAMNQAAAQGLGLTPDEGVGRSFHDLFGEPLAASRLAQLKRALATGRLQRFTDERDGTVFDHIMAPLSGSGEGAPGKAALFARDVTELIRAREEAEAASRAKSLFLANLGHEIRTPLNGILGMAQVLAGMYPDAEQSQCLDDIASASTALLELVTNLLDLSQLETGQVRLEKTLFNLVDILEAVACLAAPQAASKGLAYTTDIPPDLPRLVLGDGDKLRQILAALAGNAVKFTRQGGVTLSVRCLQACPDPQAQIPYVMVAFVVADTGIGIDQEAQERIFEAFTQADGTSTRHFGGTGLGLAIARRLARLMDGDLRVESRPGQGSRFSLTLTLALPADSADSGAAT